MSNATRPILTREEPSEAAAKEQRGRDDEEDLVADEHPETSHVALEDTLEDKETGRIARCFDQVVGDEEEDRDHAEAQYRQEP